MASRLECSPVARETWVRSQIESYQRLKKWYLMPPCLTLSIIRYGSRVKWSNPGKGVAPSPTPWCSSYRKGSLRVTLDYGRLLYFTYIVVIQFWSKGNQHIRAVWLNLLAKTNSTKFDRMNNAFYQVFENVKRQELWQFIKNDKSKKKKKKITKSLEKAREVRY